MAYPFIEVEGEVPQGNSCILYFPLTDYDHTTPVSVDNITTATLTLYDNDSGAVINNRQDVDVKNYFNALGQFNFPMSAADNQIQGGEDITRETHVAVITLTAAGADHPIEFKREFRITVLNQEHVQNAQP